MTFDTPVASATVDLEIWTAARVEVDASAPESLRIIMRWIRDHIVKPHVELGRAGPVCPFVAPALELQCLWLAAVERPIAGDADLCGIVAQLLQLYDTYEYTAGADHRLRTFVVVLPTVSNDDEWEQIARVHAGMKPTVVSRGLMLGEFHARSTSPGVHNAAYRPLRSPIPLFVLRHMVPGDLIFLNRDADPPRQRAHFLRSYLRSMAAELTPERLSEACRALVAA